MTTRRGLFAAGARRPLALAWCWWQSELGSLLVFSLMLLYFNWWVACVTRVPQHTTAGSTRRLTVLLRGLGSQVVPGVETAGGGRARGPARPPPARRTPPGRQCVSVSASRWHPVCLGAGCQLQAGPDGRGHGDTTAHAGTAKGAHAGQLGSRLRQQRQGLSAARKCHKHGADRGAAPPWVYLRACTPRGGRWCPQPPAATRSCCLPEAACGPLGRTTAPAAAATAAGR